jgi:hypothetical protein
MNAMKAMKATAAVAIAAVCVLAAPTARADGGAPAPEPGERLEPPPDDPSTALAQANAAATAGDWEAVARYVAPLLPGASLGKGDQAETHRLAGLAAYFLGRYDEAERELLAYLELDVDARLDPAVVPPEAVTFFEDVRARHGAELRALRPRSPKRHFGLNFLPPLGQFQNGHRVKGWLIAGGLVALVGTQVTTYLILRDWCDGDHRLCEPGGSDRAATARRLRQVNIATGIAAIALYAYGVIDGIRYYKKNQPTLTIEPTAGGGVLMLSGVW